MRYYLFDEISPSDMEKADNFLMQNATSSEIEKLFWVEIPKELLNEIQSRHIECQTYFFAVEMGVDWIRVELFIRSKKGLHCTCQSLCTPRQRDFIFSFIDKMIEDLDIRT